MFKWFSSWVGQRQKTSGVRLFHSWWSCATGIDEKQKDKGSQVHIVVHLVQFKKVDKRGEETVSSEAQFSSWGNGGISKWSINSSWPFAYMFLNGVHQSAF